MTSGKPRPKAPSPKSHKAKVHGEDYLSDTDPIVITLETGHKAHFNPDVELNIPDDPKEIEREALRAPKRLAFWRHQEARALRRARDADHNVDLAKASNFLYLRDDARERGVSVTDSYLRYAVEMAEESEGTSVFAQRQDALTKWEAYNIVRALADALDHRLYILRTLLRRDNGTTEA